MTRIEAPSRLHFGLLHPIAFGGVGLMIDTPGLALTVRPAQEWRAEGPSALRALQFAQAFVDTMAVEKRRPFQVLVERCPPEHAGLGSGTALALAVAKALAVESGNAEWTAVQLAQRVGRGERSAVGIHGFERGGLIVEAGKHKGEAISPLVVRYEFPPDWRAVVIESNDSAKWHGDRERFAFHRLRELHPANAGTTERLCRLVLLNLLPAVLQRDCRCFGEALCEYNAVAGEFFASVQGGTYSSPIIAETVAFLRAEGVAGAGQSSWGPTMFAIVEDVDRAIDVARRITQRFGNRCLIARANATGARTG